MTQAPPYRIETDRLVIRCWQPADAGLLKDAVDSSLEHLRAWMPWAWKDPQPLPQKIALLRGFRGRFDQDLDYTYGIFDSTESRVLGGTGFHLRREPGSFQIGYWVRADATRQGIAGEAAAVLTRIALEHCGCDRVEIEVEPGNDYSEAIPRRLGYTFEGRLGRRLEAHQGPRRDVLVFSVFGADVDAARLFPHRFRMFDAAGRRL